MGHNNWMAELSEEDLQKENERIIAKRSEMLIGKTVQGTLVSKVRSSGKTTFWVRWNKRKCDTVLVRSNLILECLILWNPKRELRLSAPSTFWDLNYQSLLSSLLGACTPRLARLRSSLTAISTRLTRRSAKFFAARHRF